MVARLTVAEEELMNLIWDKGQAFTSVEILDLADGKSWGGNYVHKMLRKLQDEGFIRVCGTVQYGTQYARQFEPLISREAYTADLLKRQGITARSLAKIALAFVKDENEKEDKKAGDGQETLIKELEDMIKQLKNKESE